MSPERVPPDRAQDIAKQDDAPVDAPSDPGVPDGPSAAPGDLGIADRTSAEHPPEGRLAHADAPSDLGIGDKAVVDCLPEAPTPDGLGIDSLEWDSRPCGDTQADPRNCGACGHDCLPGASCQAGHCQPAPMLEASESLVPFAVDGEFFYFAQYGPTLASASRVAKNAVRGTPSTLISGLSSTVFIGALGDRLFWNERTAEGSERGALCQLADCASTISHPFAQDGGLVPSNSVIGQKLALVAQDTASGSLYLSWYSVAPSGVARVAEAHAAMTGSKYGFFGDGDTVFWEHWPANAAAESAAGSLYAKGFNDDTQQPARLATGVTFETFILDVNRHSVLLVDIGKSGLYRVPLPLGLGTKPPQRLTTNNNGLNVVAATEDARGVTWFDSDGTLYRCAPDDCYASQTVLAVGQVISARRLLQDDLALYWTTSAPHQIMRLAK